MTPNEGEAGRLAGFEITDLDTARTAAGIVRARGAGTAVLTLGAGGALADGPGGAVHAAPFAVTAVDTTGAGDAFNGALAVALGEARPLGEALRFANAAAALACTRRGAQPAMPARAEVERLLRG